MDGFEAIKLIRAGSPPAATLSSRSHGLGTPAFIAVGLVVPSGCKVPTKHVIPVQQLQTGRQSKRACCKVQQVRARPNMPVITVFQPLQQQEKHDTDNHESCQMPTIIIRAASDDYWRHMHAFVYA